MKISSYCTGETTDVWCGGPDLVDELEGDWLRLLQESADNEPFYGPEWTRAYLKAFRPAGRFHLLAANVEDRLSAILPLVEQKTMFCGIPAIKLVSASNVHSCRFDIVRRAGREGDDAIQALWEHLRDKAEWDVIELREAPDGGGVEKLLEAARNDGFLAGKWESIRSPCVRLGGVSDVSEIPKRRHFRQNLRRSRHKADAFGPMRLSRFEWADPVALDRFFCLESSGWKSERGTAILCARDTIRFYEEIARAAAGHGYLSLYLLEFGETLVAGHFGLTYEGCYYTPKAAYDESYAMYGPGHILVDAVLRDCINRGLREFDFLGPWMDWKAEWANSRRTHSNCYIFRLGALGEALYLAKFGLMAALRRIARSSAIAPLRKRLEARIESNHA